MKSKIGQRYDHLTVIKEAAFAGKSNRVWVKCDCGHELVRYENQLRTPSVNYKACNQDGCEYSKIFNPNHDREYIARIRESNRRSDRKKRKCSDQRFPFKLDITLGRQLITMAWH